LNAGFRNFIIINIKDYMKYFIIMISLLLSTQCFSQQDIKLKKRDRKKDIQLLTDSGSIVLRLSDSTPLHRDNFLKLVKQGYYDSVLFHRVIKNFMIQSGDPNSRHAKKGSHLGEGGPSYTIPAEFRPSLFHKRGVLAAARTSDNVNPNKESSGSQFYIVEGKKFTSAGLDSVEINRLKGRKIPQEYRTVYETIGGAPHLDQNYTVFGEVISGLDVVDRIASTKTSGKEEGDRPLIDIYIIKASLVKRKKTIP
jgi:cyclophilin family peptidyl-prolyl cis-trans isomerase